MAHSVARLPCPTLWGRDMLDPRLKPQQCLYVNMCTSMWIENGSADMLAAKRSAGVAPENKSVRNPLLLWNSSQASTHRGQECGRMHTWMKIINPSTSSKPVMTKLQNLFSALVIIDIFQMTLEFSLFTVDCVICVTLFWAQFCVCRHAECLQMCALSSPF